MPLFNVIQIELIIYILKVSVDIILREKLTTWKIIEVFSTFEISILMQ